jgi:hypothetical protein
VVVVVEVVTVLMTAAPVKDDARDLTPLPAIPRDLLLRLAIAGREQQKFQ